MSPIIGGINFFQWLSVDTQTMFPDKLGLFQVKLKGFRVIK